MGISECSDVGERFQGTADMLRWQRKLMLNIVDKVKESLKHLGSIQCKIGITIVLYLLNLCVLCG